MTTINAHEAQLGEIATGTLEGRQVIVTTGRAAESGSDEVSPGTVRLWDARSRVPPSPEHLAFGGGVARAHLLDLDGRTVLVVCGDPLRDTQDAGDMIRSSTPQQANESSTCRPAAVA